MNKDKMKTAFSYIHETDDFSDRMTKRMNDERAKVPAQTKTHRRRMVYFFAAAAGVVAISLSTVLIINANKEVWFLSADSSRPTTSANAFVTQSTTGEVSSETSSITEVSTNYTDDISVDYSDLNFAETKAVEYPSGLQQNNEDIAPPLTDFELSHSELVIKATISEIHFNEYSDTASNTSGTNTVAYKVVIDKLYYAAAGLPVRVGDTLTIEDSLGMESPCTKDSVFQLQLNRQYILPLSYTSGKEGHMESPYSLEDPFIPQMECTEDGGYVFYAQKPLQPYEYDERIYSWFGWGEMINAGTLPVVMDTYELEGMKESLKNTMYFRSDSQFEEDFQSLCDKWCE